MAQLNKIKYPIASAALALVILYLLGIRALLLFSYSTDLNGIEFGFIHFAQLLLRGEPLYQDPGAFPFIAVLFTPLYPCLLYAIAKLSGFDYIRDVHSWLIVARALSLVCMLLNGYVIYKIFKNFRLPAFYFLAGFAVYLLLITGHFYAARPDGFKTTLFTLFLYCSLQYLFWSGRSVYAAGAVLAGIIAVHFKQDTLLNIYVVLTLALFFLRNKRSILLFGGFSAILTLSFGICYLTIGENFFINVFLLNIQETVDILHSMNFKAIGFSVLRLLPLIGLVGYEFLYRTKDQAASMEERLMLMLAIILFITAHLSMLRAASFVNYAYECSLLIVLCAALAIHKMSDLVIKHRSAAAAFLFGYIVLLFLMNTLIGNYAYNSMREAALKEDYDAMLEERDQVLATVQQDVFFFPNIKYMIFYPGQRQIYGHDMHIDRFIDAYFGLKMPTKLSFYSTDEYDAWFTDGRVKYILAENNPVNDAHVQQFYPLYKYYKTAGRFKVYQFQ